MSQGNALPQQEANLRSYHSHQSHIATDNPQPITTSSSSEQSSYSSGVVYASARPSSAVGKWLRQLGTLCRLNSTLLIRYWKAAILQVVLLPLLVVGIVFGVQKAYTSSNGKVYAADDTVTTWAMPGIQQCTVRR